MIAAEGAVKDQLVRDPLIAGVREQLPAMARLGMTPDQIVAAVGAALNDTEADLVWLLARHEVAQAGRTPLRGRARLSRAG